MSTLRTTTLKHGSSTIDNIVFDNQGRSTFGGNALFVNAQTQQVGVNTTSPSVALDVVGAINATGNVTFGGQLTLTGNLTVDTNTLFVDATNNRVGIGTTSPDQKLHVVDSAQNVARFSSTTAETNIRITNNTPSNVFLGNQNNSNFYVSTNGAQRFHIVNNGNVGIATGTPSARLQVNDASPTDGILAVFNNTTNNGGEQSGIRLTQNNTVQLRCDLVTTRTATNAGVDFSILLSDGGGTVQNRFHITEDGNIGVGISSPATGRGPLHVHSSNNVSNIHITNGNSGTGQNDGMTIFTEGTTSAGFYYRENGDLRFATNNSDRMRIDSAGRLLLGITAPYSPVGFPHLFQIEGTTSTTSSLSITRSDTTIGGTLTLAKASGGLGGNAAVASGHTLGQILFNGSNGTNRNNFSARIKVLSSEAFTTSTCAAYMAFETCSSGSVAPVERMRIRSDGGVAIGVNGLNQVNLYNGRVISGNSTSYGTVVDGIIQSDVTSNARLYHTNARIVDTSFTLTALQHYLASQGSIGASATVTNQYGFIAGNTLTGASNNYGFYGNLASGTGRWNFYANGGAQNYFAGSLLVGTTNVNPVVGNVDGFTARSEGHFLSCVTSAAPVSGMRRNSDGDIIRFYNNSTTECGSITLTGQATSFVESSDYRLKENIAPLTGAANQVKALKPCVYNFKAEPNTTLQGFIAHEAQEVCPQAVTGTKDETEAIGTLFDWDGSIREENVIEPAAEKLTYTEEVVTTPAVEAADATYDEEGEELTPAVEAVEEVRETVTRQMTWEKTADRDVMQGIDKSKLVPLLTAALQEALERIEVLEQRVLE